MAISGTIIAFVPHLNDHFSPRETMDRVFRNEGGFEDKEIGIIRSTLKWRARPDFPLEESGEESVRSVPSDRARVKEEKVA